MRRGTKIAITVVALGVLVLGVASMYLNEKASVVHVDTSTGNIDHLNQMLAISVPTASNKGSPCQAGEPGSS